MFLLKSKNFKHSNLRFKYNSFFFKKKFGGLFSGFLVNKEKKKKIFLESNRKHTDLLIFFLVDFGFKQGFFFKCFFKQYFDITKNKFNYNIFYKNEFKNNKFLSRFQLLDKKTFSFFYKKNFFFINFFFIYFIKTRKNYILSHNFDIFNSFYSLNVRNIIFYHIKEFFIYNRFFIYNDFFFYNSFFFSPKYFLKKYYLNFFHKNFISFFSIKINLKKNFLNLKLFSSFGFFFKKSIFPSNRFFIFDLKKKNPFFFLLATFNFFFKNSFNNKDILLLKDMPFFSSYPVFFKKIHNFYNRIIFDKKNIQIFTFNNFLDEFFLTFYIFFKKDFLKNIKQKFIFYFFFRLFYFFLQLNTFLFFFKFHIHCFKGFFYFFIRLTLFLKNKLLKKFLKLKKFKVLKKKIFFFKNFNKEFLIKICNFYFFNKKNFKNFLFNYSLLFFFYFFFIRNIKKSIDFFFYKFYSTFKRDIFLDEKNKINLFFLKKKISRYTGDKVDFYNKSRYSKGFFFCSKKIDKSMLKFYYSFTFYFLHFFFILNSNVTFFPLNKNIISFYSFYSKVLLEKIKRSRKNFSFKLRSYEIYSLKTLKKNIKDKKKKKKKRQELYKKKNLMRKLGKQNKLIKGNNYFEFFRKYDLKNSKLIKKLTLNDKKKIKKKRLKKKKKLILKKRLLLQEKLKKRLKKKKNNNFFFFKEKKIKKLFFFFFNLKKLKKNFFKKTYIKSLKNDLKKKKFFLERLKYKAQKNLFSHVYFFLFNLKFFFIYVHWFLNIIFFNIFIEKNYIQNFNFINFFYFIFKIWFFFRHRFLFLIFLINLRLGFFFKKDLYKGKNLIIISNKILDDNNAFKFSFFPIYLEKKSKFIIKCYKLLLKFKIKNFNKIDKNFFNGFKNFYGHFRYFDRTSFFTDFRLLKIISFKIKNDLNNIKFNFKKLNFISIFSKPLTKKLFFKRFKELKKEKMQLSLKNSNKALKINNILKKVYKLFYQINKNLIFISKLKKIKFLFFKKVFKKRLCFLEIQSRKLVKILNYVFKDQKIKKKVKKINFFKKYDRNLIFKNKVNKKRGKKKLKYLKSYKKKEKVRVKYSFKLKYLQKRQKFYMHFNLFFSFFYKFIIYIFIIYIFIIFKLIDFLIYFYFLKKFIFLTFLLFFEDFFLLKYYLLLSFFIFRNFLNFNYFFIDIFYLRKLKKIFFNFKAKVSIFNYFFNLQNMESYIYNKLFYKKVKKNFLKKKDIFDISDFFFNFTNFFFL